MSAVVSPIASLSTAAASQASAATSSSQSAAQSNAAIDSTSTLGNENTFLQLLVAQIKNQDPTQPVDSSTFLSQLAEFSQLEQLIGIRQDVGQLDPATGATTGTTTTGTTPASQS